MPEGRIFEAKLDATWAPLAQSHTGAMKEARRSNLRRRPIGLGVQGLADDFAMMRLPLEIEGRGGRTMTSSIPSDWCL